ncbi:hypothetical protein LLE49_10280 [Alicyclobacillus tolerans]|uniref:hypothetical protein n=1 Tax=Alicyclobacillus tolerans TaxID=90970 RepID=UPI001F36B613|nr:hypothetical protein [Alicyclobacillus tolerans]MCF8565100.1 hypothetical protein [Alicyclobacillus tolerans]
MFLIDNQTEHLEVEVENIQRRWLGFSQFVVGGGVQRLGGFFGIQSAAILLK